MPTQKVDYHLEAPFGKLNRISFRFENDLMVNLI